MADLVLTFDPTAVGAPLIAKQVATGYLEDAAITSAKIAPNALATPHIQNQGILSASIGTNIIGTPHILNQGILSASVGAGAIGDAHIRSGVVDAAKLTGTLQDARIPTTLAGRVFSGPVESLDSDAYIMSGVGGVWLAQTGTYQFSRLAVNVRKAEKHLTSGAAYLLHVGREDEPGNAGLVLWRSPPAPAGSGFTFTKILQILSGNITQINFVDGVDISAHTHTAGAGDASRILSAGVGSGQIGDTLMKAGGVLSAAYASGSIGWAHIAPGAASRSLFIPWVGGTPRNLNRTVVGVMASGSQFSGGATILFSSPDNFHSITSAYLHWASASGLNVNVSAVIAILDMNRGLVSNAWGQLSSQILVQTGEAPFSGGVVAPGYFYREGVLSILSGLGSGEVVGLHAYSDADTVSGLTTNRDRVTYLGLELCYV